MKRRPPRPRMPAARGAVGGSRTSTLSRRRFLSLIAAGSVAALAAPARELAATATTAAKKPAPAPSPRMLAEIEKQKKSVADALKAIRAYALPPGSDMAFEFRPLRRGRRK